MRRFSLLILLGLTLSACWHSAIIDGRKVDDPPRCLMTFSASSGCWADGRWYEECPWTLGGAERGYFAFDEGEWRMHPHTFNDPKDGPPPEEWCVDGSLRRESFKAPKRVR